MSHTLYVTARCYRCGSTIREYAPGAWEGVEDGFDECPGLFMGDLHEPFGVCRKHPDGACNYGKEVSQ